MLQNITIFRKIHFLFNFTIFTTMLVKTAKKEERNFWRFMHWNHNIFFGPFCSSNLLSKHRLLYIYCQNIAFFDWKLQEVSINFSSRKKEPLFKIAINFVTTRKFLFSTSTPIQPRLFQVIRARYLQAVDKKYVTLPKWHSK